MKIALTGWIFKVVKECLLKFDIGVNMPAGRFNSFEYKIRKAKTRGLAINSVVDGGAAEGEWTKSIRRIFPNSSIVCIEPRTEVLSSLNSVAENLGNVKVIQALLGKDEQVINLNMHGEQSSIFGNSSGSSFGKSVAIKMSTLDSLISEIGFPSPDYIKLDLQGAELQCLEGASKCLKNAKAVQLEVSFLPIQKGMPLIADVFGFMLARGFVCYDILALSCRPLDGAMAQGDFLFVPAESVLRADPRWAAGVEFS